MGSLVLAFHAFHGPSFPRLHLSVVGFASFLLPFERPPETIRFGAGFEDVRSIGDAVQQRFAEPGIWNHLRPFRERQVGRKNHAGSFGPFGDDLEQELRTDFRQRNITDFVNGDQIVTAPASHHSPQLQLMFGFHQFVHQRGRRCETNAPFLPARGHAQASQKMRLPGSAIANQQNGFGALDIAAVRQLAHLRRLDQRSLVEVELLQCLHSRQARFLDAPLNRVPLPLFDLGRQQRFQIPDVRSVLAAPPVRPAC